MALDQKKYDYALKHLLRDTRPWGARAVDAMSDSDAAAMIFLVSGVLTFLLEEGVYYLDIVFLFNFLYFLWLRKRPRPLYFKLPATAQFKDPRERSGKASGIMFLGNTNDHNEEVWFTNNDARTHVLYLGTTGSGKTEGLKSIATNALAWGSGFIYVDGKADTDLWSSLSALVRRFGRDDDLLVLNYMTGNSDDPAPSNSLNPFANGSASYLTNMLVSLMPEAEGDNAMWKERAVSLLSSLMPALTWKREHQELPLSISTIRQYLNFPEIIKLSRDDSLPDRIREGMRGYLDTLPGYSDAAFDDNGMEKPMGPDQPMVDTNTPKQQHGYLTMQFTRALQSLGNDYGYIFDSQNADIDMMDVVLNRRILVVLIPALEKSGDEAANLGKIVAATLKGMMGSTLGATVEGESSAVIENKPTRSATPFITIFDEVGYYATQGMGVMAAQARSLGFCLVYSAQDMAALEKRVKEEARSITGNCNIKIFGKLEDPMQTQDFFEKTVGKALTTEVGGFQMNASGFGYNYYGQNTASMQLRGRSSYDELRGFKEGDAIVCFADRVTRVKMFYCNPGHAKAMRVQRFVGLPKSDDFILRHVKDIAALRDRLSSKDWTALKAERALTPSNDLAAVVEGLKKAGKAKMEPVRAAAAAIAAAAIALGMTTEDGAASQPAANYASAQAGTSQTAPMQQPQFQQAPQMQGDGDNGGNPMSFFSKGPSRPMEENRDGGMSWADLISDNSSGDVDTQTDAMDDEDEDSGDTRGSASGGSSSGGVKPDLSDVHEVKAEQYSPEKAVEEKARSGATLLPEGLSDEVKSILKGAADSLSAGLFGAPTIQQDAEKTAEAAPTRKPPTTPRKR